MLNKGQQEAKELISNFIKNEVGVFGLLGAGGTGKTYLITSINGSEEYQYLAPTNKAVNVLRKGLIQKDVIKPNVKTIDSFFRLRMKKDADNKTIYSYKQPAIDKIPKVIIVDECSMLTSNHIDLILNMNKKIPVIFLGDDMQLPPVEEDDNIFIDKDGFKKSLSFSVMKQSYTLTEQNRQNKDSDLYNLINGFRVDMGNNIPIRNIAFLKNNGIDILYYKQNSQELNNFIKENESFAVTFKNNTSDYFNYKIGSVKTGSKKYNIREVNEGETLVFNSFYMRDDVCFYTSEMINVVSIFQENVQIEIPISGAIVEATQKKAIVKNENGLDKVIWLKNSELLKKVWQRVYYYKNKINKAKDLAELNTFYSDFKNGFANLKKPFSLTTHKSQGSTFKNVIIPIYDFYKKNHRDANQLIYVAMSRASEKIVFVDGWCNFNGSTKRVNFTEEERCLIAGSQNWKCNDCGIDLEDAKYDIDHKVRLGSFDEKGNLGTNNIGNLQALCKECHKHKTSHE